MKTPRAPCDTGVAPPDQCVGGRLNAFQRTMLQWNDLHPYNAVHVVRISEPPDLPRLQNLVNSSLVASGLTGLVLDRREGTYAYQGGRADSPLRIVAAGGEPRASLSAEIEWQLNTPFAESAPFAPCRFFVAPEAESFWLGLVYFHPAADAESAVWLLKALAGTYRSRQASEFIAPLDRSPRGPERWLLRRPGTLIRALAAVPGTVGSMRRSCRPPCADPADTHNGFRLLPLERGCLRSMRTAAKGWGVTLNDLVVAALLKALSPLATGRWSAPWRRELAIGIIVNLRKELEVVGPGTFGLLLGSFRVGHEVPDGMRLKELARAVSRQTGRAKRARAYLATPVQLAFVRCLFSRLSPDRRLRFYPKHYPLWGGITNLNLNALWDLRAAEGPVDYFRAVSTGPATPLVVSLTTVRDQVNLGLSYRSAVFSERDMEQVGCGLSGALAQPGASS